MMKNKVYLSSILSGMLLLSVCSCSNFLEEVNWSSQTADVYFQTRSGYEGLINGCYTNLRSIYNSKDYIIVTQLGTDIGTQTYSGNVTPINQYTTTFDSNQGNIFAYWRSLYTALKNVNAAIDRAGGVVLKTNDPDGIDPAVLEQRVAEAKTLRALYLFEIVRNWGQAPLLVNEPTAPEKTSRLNSGTEFYAQILKDLSEAISVLPVRRTGADYGRVSGATAQHLRALVYLTRGYQHYADANDFTNAVNDAKNVIDNSGHVLLDDYQSVHAQSNETNAEIIFSIGFSPAANHNVNFYPKLYLFSYREGWIGLSKDSYYSNDDATLLPTKYMYLLADWDKDRRPEVTFMSPVNADPATSTDGRNTGKNWFQCTMPVSGRFALGDTVVYFPVPTDPGFKYWTDEDKQTVPYVVYNFPAGDPADMSTDEYFRNGYQSTSAQTRCWLPVWKFKDKNTTYLENGNSTGTRDIYLYRLAETYLIAAEACVKKGDNANALFYLNKVRQRAEKAPGSLVKSEGSTVTIDDILDERAIELFGEAPRWNDLQRTGKLNERVLKYNWDVTHITGGIPAQLTESSTQFYLRPIPLQWLNSLSNGQELGNNPGW
jgi:hypothetical protein